MADRLDGGAAIAGTGGRAPAAEPCDFSADAVADCRRSGIRRTRRARRSQARLRGEPPYPRRGLAARRARCIPAGRRRVLSLCRRLALLDRQFCFRHPHAGGGGGRCDPRRRFRSAARTEFLAPVLRRFARGDARSGRADRRLDEGWAAVSLLGDALVLFSGGQDSTVCLAWALQRFARVETIGFDYGQRHAVELAVRPRIRERLAQLSPQWHARIGEDHLVKIDALATISDTALTREVAIEISESGLPTTFVPGRNLVFFSFAGAVAYRRGIKHLVAGMCETDFSGYPDCRDDTVKAMQLALTLGMDRRFVVHTPLMWIDKAGTFALAHDIGGDALIDLLLAETHTCYLGDRQHRHAWGFGCGECPACRLRADGYAKWKAAS